MPELPEVETMRLGILGAEGSRVIAASRARCRKKTINYQPRWPTIARRITGRKISEIGRHGKRIKIHFDSGDTMVIEPRMTGLILVEEPPTREHLRFEMTLAGGDCSQIRFWDRRGLAHVHLFDRNGLAEFFDSGRIGPDALEITPDQLRENLCDRTIPVKVGLLDQKSVAGIGNIYASEILHLARIDPRLSCQRVTRKGWNSIHKSLLLVMHSAIRNEGSTLADGTYRNALNNPGNFQNHHLVYDREGEQCKSCKSSKIKKIVQAQRSTYFCPRCQTTRKRSS